MDAQHTWDFTDDRGLRVTAPSRPERFVAYIQAGATLWDHGLRPEGLFGSHHDGAAQDPAKAGGLPLEEIRSFGSGSGVDLDGLLAAAPDLVVAVTYGGDQVYGLDPDTAKHLGEQVPLVVLDVGTSRSLAALRDRFADLARALGARPGATETGQAELARAQERLRTLAARTARPRVLALSAAGAETAYLARAAAWPDLRALRDLGVALTGPGDDAGGNWRTVEWEEAAALRPDIVLADVRTNAASAERLAGSAGWREIAERAQILPWNPEPPASHHAHAAFFETVADAM
ncbi:ABC transporter substrate-binding protein [Streptomyces fuscigenes]|uniref:ABC transporter substrate-binding protein n=1 Tax=Streptomyces fuscigenes TaxID=1528880 RepID=UPI001F3B7D11|nr:ABC transporter substrate-binding protein [Streptomyces fuscigenes]MCF3960846.1 ABC transporter substrate-binding protein [Streptomyces fuscigenes]